MPAGAVPGELGIVVERGGQDVNVLRLAGGGGQSGQCCGVEAGDVSDVVEVDELEQVAVLGAVFDADVLVLVVEVLAPLGETDGGEASRLKLVWSPPRR